MLTFDKPLAVSFDLNISGTRQKPSAVLLTISDPSKSVSFSCVETGENHYEVQPLIPVGIFEAGQVQLSIEAVYGQNRFSIYKKPVEISLDVELVPADQVPDEPDVADNEIDLVVAIEDDAHADDFVESTPRDEPADIQRKEPSATVDLRLENYVPPRSLIKDLVATEVATVSPQLPPKTTASPRVYESRQLDPVFSVRRLSKILL